MATYSPLGAVSKVNSKWLAWLMRKPWAGRTAPSESVTARRSSPERSCARVSGERSRRRRAALIETRRRWILRGRLGEALGHFTAMTGRGFGRERYYFRAEEGGLCRYEQPLECCPFGPRHSEMVVALEMRPSCARLGQRGAAVPTQSLDGRDAHPHTNPSETFGGGDGGHGFL